MAERPVFARDFPRDPALDALVDAFVKGDYGRVRAGASRMAETTQDAAIRGAAKELIVRTRPDPLAVALLGVAAALLVALSVYWMAHGEPPARTPRPATVPSGQVR